MELNQAPPLQIEKSDFKHQTKKLILLRDQENMKSNKTDQIKNLKLNNKRINDKLLIGFAFHPPQVFLHMNKFLVMMRLLQATL